MTTFLNTILCLGIVLWLYAGLSGEQPPLIAGVNIAVIAAVLSLSGKVEVSK